MFPAFNLTSWGFRDAETDDDNGSFGGMLPKLLFRALPRHYNTKNVYAHFPFMVPGRMRQYMEKHPAMVKEYDWARPRAGPVIKTVQEFNAVKEVVSNTTTFSMPYETPMTSLTNGYGFYLGSSDSANFRWNRVMVYVPLVCALRMPDMEIFFGRSNEPSSTQLLSRCMRSSIMI